MAPWTGGKTQAANTQLDGVERKWSNDGICLESPSGVAGRGQGNCATRCLLCLLDGKHSKWKTFPDQ